MSALAIRDATADDAEAICAIWNPIIRDSVITFNPDPRNPAEVIGLIAGRHEAGHAFLVATLSGQVIGFASYSQFRPGPGYARSVEHTINLSPQARGYGAGRRLLAALEAHATAAGHHVMVAAVSAENAGSVAFHRAMGYQNVGLMPQVGWKFGQFHDLVLMQKTLSAGVGPSAAAINSAK
ncbi:MAG: N-acetyltransferase [Rhodobacteraceae bacterium]|nr:N-acetyltransferase [Paracoccaceae bacterium]